MITGTSRTHIADLLISSVERFRTPACVGIDPVVERLPREILDRPCQTAGRDQERLSVFSRCVIEAVKPHVSCVKIQSGCFERYGASGHVWLEGVLDFAKMEIPTVILDAKRGDIGVTAEHYAAGIFDLDKNTMEDTPDWLTINSYLGDDGITPFLKPGHGAFALVRTSNPGGDQVQNLELKDGRTVAQAVGEMIARIGSKDVGTRGYSSLGAVVGATKPQDAKRLREIMPQQMFLVPGYGAQGAGLDDILPCFKSDGGGAIVTASRSVIYAFNPDDPKWMDSVADAAARFAEEVGRAVGMRR